MASGHSLPILYHMRPLLVPFLLAVCFLSFPVTVSVLLFLCAQDRLATMGRLPTIMQRQRLPPITKQQRPPRPKLATGDDNDNHYHTNGNS